MKWKGRRQSNNIEDMRDDDAIKTIIKNSTVEYDGGVSPGALPKDKSRLEGESKVQKELSKHDKNKTIPTPTPRPSQKMERIQVTPGKWKST